MLGLMPSMALADSFQIPEVDIDLEFFIKDRVTIQYGIGLGKRLEDNRTHLHFAGGPVLGGALIFSGIKSNIESDDTTGSFKIGSALIVAGIIAMFIPERISYNIYAGSNLRIAPYLAFAGIDLAKLPNEDITRLQYRWGGGLAISLFNADKRTQWSVSGGYQHITKIGGGPVFALKGAINLSK